MPAEPPYLTPPVTPPEIVPNVVTGGAKINTIPLTPHEQAIFRRDLSRMATMYSLERPLHELLMDDIDTLMVAAAYAKGSIGTNPNFTGLLANGNEIGFQMIRAATALSGNKTNNPGQTAAVYDWVQTYTSSGWTNVFGSATNPIDLSSTGISGVAVSNTQNRVLLAVIALLDPTTSPQLSEVRWHVENVDYPVEPIAWQPMTNLFYAKLQGMYVVTVNGRAYMRGNVQPSTTGGQDATQLFGLAFATGTYLTYE